MNPVPGHGRRGVRNKKKTVTQEEEEERDAESAYADFPRVDLAFCRLISGPSGFICLSKRNRSRARPERCLGMMAHAMWLSAPSLAWFWAVPASSAAVPRHDWGTGWAGDCSKQSLGVAELLTPRMGAVPCSLLLGPRAKQLHPVSPGPTEGRPLKCSPLQPAYLPPNFPLFPSLKMGNVTQQVVGECVGWECVRQTETGKRSVCWAWLNTGL